MAFTLVASVGDVSTILNNGNPFSLESAEGLSGASIVRHEQGGPLQSGVTDLGYRVVPRVITLNLLFRADTDAALDAHRDTLLSTFKPLTGISIFLTATRDDGEIRKLVCHAVDDIALALAPELRPGHMHRATVKLRAADPLWQSNSVTTTALDYGTADQWYLAGGAIDEERVLDHIEYPVNQQIWEADHAHYTDPWAVAMVTSAYMGTTATTGIYAFKKDFSGVSGTGNLQYTGTAGRFRYNRQTNSGSGFLWPGTFGENLHIIGHNGSQDFWAYLTAPGMSTAITYHSRVAVSASQGRLGTAGRWRGESGSFDDWPDIRKAMIWVNTDSTADFESEMNALIPYILGSAALGTTYTGTVNVVNSGDVPAYPFIALRGPIADPVITNVTTGASIDFTGLTLPAGSGCNIDLSGGNKTMSNSETPNMLGSVPIFPISIADFHIAPAPVAAGGTNVITMTSGSATSNARFTVEFTEKYMSF